MKLQPIPTTSSKSSIFNNKLYTHTPSAGVYSYIDVSLPRHHWKFCENLTSSTIAFDAGSYPNRLNKYGTGTLLGNPGKIDYAVYIPSATTANYLASDHAYAEIYKNMTISTWIKIDAFNLNGTSYIYHRNNTHVFIKQESVRGGGYRTTFSYRYNIDYLFEFSVNHPNLGTSWYGVNSGDWFLLTCVAKQVGNYLVFSCYVNSILVHNSNALLLLSTSATFDTTNYHYIGNSTTPNSANTLNGYLCDLRIYDRALTAQEIAMLYNYGYGTYQQSIISSYPTSLQPITHLKLQEKLSNNRFNDSGKFPNLWHGLGLQVPSGVTNYNIVSSNTYCYYNSADNQLTGTSNICQYPNHTYCLWYRKIGSSAGNYIIRTANNGSINLETLTGGTYDLRVRVYNGYIDIAAGVDVWVHIVVTLNNSTKTFRVYIGGEFVGSGTWSSGTCVSTFSLLNSNCVGYVQDFRIYPYILNDSEIKNLYNDGLGLLV